MGQTTNIGWCDSTLNLQMGCLGCELWDKAGKVRTCYAGNLVERHAGQPGWPASFDRPEIYPHRLAPASHWRDLTGSDRPDKPWLNGYPRVVFLNDLGDTFTEGLPDDWLAPYLAAMACLPWIVLILTKRSTRARAFFDRHDCPPNVMLGFSVTDPATARLRLPDLLAARVAGRFLSAEPWLGPGGFPAPLDGIDWVILGGESAQHGPAGQPRSSNLDDLRLATLDAREGGAAVFIKQVGSAPVGFDARTLVGITAGDPKGEDWGHWPDELRVRELPPGWRDVIISARPQATVARAAQETKSNG